MTQTPFLNLDKSPISQYETYFRIVVNILDKLTVACHFNYLATQADFCSLFFLAKGNLEDETFVPESKIRFRFTHQI